MDEIEEILYFRKSTGEIKFKNKHKYKSQRRYYEYIKNLRHNEFTKKQDSPPARSFVYYKKHFGYKFQIKPEDTSGKNKGKNKGSTKGTSWNNTNFMMGYALSEINFPNIPVEIKYKN